MIKGQFMMSMTIALVGNPNCGKTTMFNTLTGGINMLETVQE